MKNVISIIVLVFLVGLMFWVAAMGILAAMSDLSDPPEKDRDGT